MKGKNYKDLKVFHFADLITKQFNKKNLSGVVFGNFGAQNMGDETILSGELTEINRISGVNAVVVSKNPDEIGRLHHTSSISLYNPLKIFNDILTSDFVIVGGGGIICKPDRGFMGIIYQIYTLLFSLLLPKLLKKRIFVLGLGIYENANPLILKTSMHLLRPVDLLTVRDFHSYALLKKHGVKSQIYKDNSFLMAQLKKNEIRNDIYFRKNYHDKSYNLGLALLSPEKKSEEKYLISEITQLIKANNKNTHYWFYACDYQKGFNNDLIFIHKVIDQITKDIGYTIRYSIVPTSFTPQKFFSSFMLMDYIISMRLHASIFAYRNKIEFTGLTYDTKCTSFLESIGKIPVRLDGLRQNNKLLFNTI